MPEFQLSHFSSSSSSSQMALQSTADLHLLKGLLPVSSVFFSLFPICNFAFINIYLYTIPHSKLLSSTLISYPFPLSGSIPLSLTFLRPQFRFPNSQLFYGDRFLACCPTPNLEGQSTIFITPGAEWPSFTAGSGYPFRSPFTTRMGCSGTILFPSHHMGTLTLIYIYMYKMCHMEHTSDTNVFRMQEETSFVSAQKCSLTSLGISTQQLNSCLQSDTFHVKH